jgi:hypothetical protein
MEALDVVGSCVHEGVSSPAIKPVGIERSCRGHDQQGNVEDLKSHSLTCIACHCRWAISTGGR